MKKFALLLAVAVAASVSTAALAADKPVAKKSAKAAAATDLNAPGKKLVGEMFKQPVYALEAAAKPAKKADKKADKKSGKKTDKKAGKKAAKKADKK